jgi:hypothetical protein
MATLKGGEADLASVLSRDTCPASPSTTSELALDSACTKEVAPLGPSG